jgi:hypothetical protein
MTSNFWYSLAYDYLADMQRQENHQNLVNIVYLHGSKNHKKRRAK